MTADMPLYPYKKYPHSSLRIAHYADEYIPIIAMVYTLLVFILYCQQYATRRKVWFSAATIPLHTIALIALCILFLYELSMFLLATDYYRHFLPHGLDSCQDYIRFIFLSFIFVKYAMIYCIILNLSYINQNPFINPRYKYIGKHSRIRLKRFFNAILVIAALFFGAGFYGAWVHTESEQYRDVPDDFSYCTQTFTITNFFFTFSGDILGFLLFSCLFGRNACDLCRRKVKPHQRAKYDVGNLSDVGEYDDDKHYDYNKVNYDLDDPIRNKLTMELKYGINNPEPMHASMPTHDARHKSAATKTNVYGGYSDNLIVDISNDDESGDYAERMNKEKLSLKKLRDSSLIEAEEIISEEEYFGIREQKRVLRLVWIMLLCYWLNILVVIFLGLFENVSCCTLMVTSTCIVLMNDYEFGSTYWKCRNVVCRIGAWLCCLCRKTYVCEDCFCGTEKVYHDKFEPVHASTKRHANDTDLSGFNKFVRL